MELSQLSVRVIPSLISRLKMRAKEESISVNNLVTAMLETGLNDGGISAEYGRLKAEPVIALAKIHRKLCDPWETGNTHSLSDAERKFLAEGARERINNTLLAGSYYDSVNQIAMLSETINQAKDYRTLLAFCVRHYIDDMSERMQFAKDQCPDNLKTATYHIKAYNLDFTIAVTGTELNRFATAEERRPPVFSLLCKGEHFEATLDWDAFTALVRLLASVRQGVTHESRGGASARLICESVTAGEWGLLLGKMQLRIDKKTLDKLAAEIGELVEGDFSSAYSQLLLIYGEG